MNYFISKLFFWIASVLGILGFCTSCSLTKDISKEPPYSQCIGKKFILKEDVYLFQDHGSSQLSIAGPNSGVSGLTKFVDPKFIGRDNGQLLIRSIIKKDSIFSIVNVSCIQQFESSYIEFLIKFDGINLSKHGINTTCILNLNNPPDTKTWSDPPIFKANLVEPLPSDGVWWK